MKVSVDLSDELTAAVVKAVASGAYDTPQAVVQEAMFEWLLARAKNARTRSEIDVLLGEAFREMETTPAIPWTPELMEDVKRRGRERMAGRVAAE